MIEDWRPSDVLCLALIAAAMVWLLVSKGKGGGKK